MSKANFFQIMPCKHCGYIGYHLWAGSGLCPGLTVEDQDMPESMFYYQMGFKQGYNQATSDITAKDAESHPRPASVLSEECQWPNHPNNIKCLERHIPPVLEK